MKSFKYWLQEAAVAKVDNPGKNFEVDIVNYINDPQRKDKDWTNDVKLAGKQALNLGAIESMTADDYALEFEPKFKLSPFLGKAGQPKADILFKIKGKWTPISVKMDGRVVIASAQNKIEYENIFLVTTQLYEEKYGNKGLETFKKTIDKTRNDVIGQVYNSQELTTGRQTSILQKVEKLDNLSPKQIETIKKELQRNNVLNKEDIKGGVFYEDIKKGMENFSKNFAKDMDKVPGLKELIVFEAITAYNKFNPDLKKDEKSRLWKNIKNKEFESRQVPTRAWANYIISPSGLHDVTDPKGSYIKAAAQSSAINYRGLPTGKSRDSKSGMKLVQQIFAPDGKFGIPNNDSFKQFFKEVGVWSMNMKIDTTTQAIEKELKNLKTLNNEYESESGNLIEELIECRTDIVKNENILNEKMILFESNNSPELIQEIKFIRNLIDKGKQLFGKLKNKFKSVLKSFTEKMKMFYRKLVEHTKTFFDMIANLSLTEASLMFKMTLASDSKIKLP